ncbi:MAG: DUF420 domain-containing protein [Candidatus Bathyarchaeum sp.]|nr:MAG: DUF420 domain-containing protein [Candidatus Bathyarchaeum sp.]
MTGILGTNAHLGADINLILQIIMFLLLIIGLIYKKKRKFRIHGSIMAIAVILHVITFLTVMVPPFLEGFNYFITTTSDFRVQMTLAHAIPGAIAMILGIVLVEMWAIRPSNIATCSKRKRLMDVTALLWLVSLIFGIATYFAYYL